MTEGEQQYEGRLMAKKCIGECRSGVLVCWCVGVSVCWCLSGSMCWCVSVLVCGCVSVGVSYWVRLSVYHTVAADFMSVCQCICALHYSMSRGKGKVLRTSRLLGEGKSIGE